MKPAFVLGIDGLPYTLAKRLIAEGVMPNLGVLAGRGTLAKMHTAVPDFSCVAWTSLATGVNPGKHGIYGFQDFNPNNGEQFLPDATHCRAAPLWHAVGEAGGRSVVLNLPNTYPAMPLRGKMVAGFVATEFDKACYPQTFAQTLRALGYRMDLDGRGGLGSPEHVFESLGPVFEARKAAIRHVIRNEYWDLAIAVITETDRLQHFYLHALHDPAHAQHAWTRNFYAKLDDFIGEVAGMLEGRAELYMVSDHGFEVVRHEIVLQDLLRDLELAPESAAPCWSVPEIAARTKVFTLDPGRFYINRRGGRFPYGCVEEKDVAAILERLRSALLGLRDPETGEPMVHHLRSREEGFWGKMQSCAPDLVAAANPGYYFRSFRMKESAHAKESHWEANHVWNDAIVYTPFRLDRETQPMIWDVLPTVVSRMGVPLPDGLDGRSLVEAGVARAQVPVGMLENL